MNQFSFVFLKKTNCSGQKATLDQCLYIPAQTPIGEHAGKVFFTLSFLYGQLQGKGEGHTEQLYFEADQITRRTT